MTNSDLQIHTSRIANKADKEHRLRRVMYYFTAVLLCIVAGMYCFNQTEENINYLVNLITKNILETQSYQLPDYFEGFEVKSKKKAPLDFGSFDFIIVGAGAGGSLLARRLSERSDWKILLLEGGESADDFVDIPAVFNHLQNSKYSWGFKTTPQLICQDRPNSICDYARGKGLGGTTLLYTLVHARGTASDYNNWHNLGLEGWSFPEVLPYFKRYENASLLSKIETYLHGFDGPFSFANYRNISKIEKAFKDSLENFGFSETDYNGRNIYGYGRSQTATVNGKRNDAFKAYLSGLQRTHNLKIQSNSLATKVIIKNGAAKSVEFIYKNVRYTAKATKEVILSAGSVGSPQLLMLSGIGPKRELRKHNINIVKDLPVGKIFQDRPGVSAIFQTNIPGPVSIEPLVAEYLEGVGPLTISQRSVVAFFKTSKNKTMEMMLLDGGGLLPQNGSVKFGSNVFGIRVALLHPKSQGNLTLSSNNPIDFPVINTNLLSEIEDEEAMIEALNLITDVAKSEPLSQFNATFEGLPICNHLSFKSDEYWKCYLRSSMSDHALHPIGSCKMGTDPSNSVVDNRLRVHGVNNLRVVDGSVMPTCVTGHQFGTIFMIAEKASDMIFEDYGIVRT